MTLQVQTSRLTLSPYTAGDADALMLNAGHPDVARMMASIPLPFTREAALSRIAKGHCDGNRFALAVRLRDTGEAIGEITAGRKDPDSPARLGYFLRPDYQGRGFIGKALALALDHAFRTLDWPLIEAEAMDENPASARVLTRAGFVPVGAGTCPSLARGDAPPSTLYRLTRADRYAPTLHTDRLTLRPRKIEDAPRHTRLLDDPIVARMLTSVPHPYMLADSREWLSGALDRPAGIDLTVDDGSGVIGAVGLSFDSPVIRTLGFWIGTPYHGKGLATEAVRALIDWAFRTHGLEKIESVAFMDNTGSRRVHAKLGFVETGTEILHSPARNAVGEGVTFALTRTDWTAGP